MNIHAGSINMNDDEEKKDGKKRPELWRIILFPISAGVIIFLWVQKLFFHA